MPFKYNALLGLGLDNTIPLDGAGKIPSTFLPSYVDDVEEYNNLAAFPATGETGKIYVAINTGFVYRWSGSVYVQIGITAAAGSTTQVQFNDGGAFGGDSGLTFDKTTDALSAGGFIPTSSTVPANGIYLPAANSVGVATNGTGRLLIDASGNVGVGTSLPSNQLTVSANGLSSITLDWIGDNLPKATFSANHATGEVRMGATNNSGTYFATLYSNNQERLRITSAGLVGIGTSVPADALHLASGNLRLTNGAAFSTANSLIRSISSFAGSANQFETTRISSLTGAFTNRGEIAFSTGDDTSLSEKVRIDYLGRLGIGTTSPTGNLHVVGVSGTSIIRAVGADAEGNADAEIFSTGSAGNSRLYFSDTAAQSGSIIYNHNTNSFAFATSGSERARIDSSGRLLVGTSTSRSVQDFSGNGPESLIQIEAANSVAIMSIISAGTADAGRAGTLSLGRHRNATVGGTPTVVQSGDLLGAICFAGGDGTDMLTKGAAIACQVDGTPGADDMPGRLVFSVTADGAASPTEAMRIKSTRIVNIANTPVHADNAAAKTAGLVDGDVYRKSDGTMMIVFT